MQIICTTRNLPKRKHHLTLKSKTGKIICTKNNSLRGCKNHAEKRGKPNNIKGYSLHKYRNHPQNRAERFAQPKMLLKDMMRGQGRRLFGQFDDISCGWLAKCNREESRR